MYRVPFTVQDSASRTVNGERRTVNDYDGSSTSSSGSVCSGFSTVGDSCGRAIGMRRFGARFERRAVFLLFVPLFAARAIFLRRGAALLFDELFLDLDLLFAFVRRFLAMHAPHFFIRGEPVHPAQSRFGCERVF